MEELAGTLRICCGYVTQNDEVCLCIGAACMSTSFLLQIRRKLFLDTLMQCGSATLWTIRWKLHRAENRSCIECISCHGVGLPHDGINEIKMWRISLEKLDKRKCTVNAMCRLKTLPLFFPFQYTRINRTDRDSSEKQYNEVLGMVVNSKRDRNAKYCAATAESMKEIEIHRRCRIFSKCHCIPMQSVKWPFECSKM